jgi:phenolic acid decarboxylase
MYEAILDTPYPETYVYFENDLLSLSSLSRKELDNLESYIVEEFTRYTKHD